MKKLALVFALLVPMAAACGGGGGAAELLKKMEEAKNKTCACKDKACVDKVKEEMMGWMMKNADKFKNVKPTKAQDEKADKLDDEMDKCAEKFDKPADPPPADPAPADPAPADPAPADPAAPAPAGN
ncbi:MAG: hypothetical protein IPL61_16075 [Myxococcales bacterium]|nr:hypothetical protein [Myxococcales bacterium]